MGFDSTSGSKERYGARRPPDPQARRITALVYELGRLSSRDKGVRARANRELGELVPTTAELLKLLRDGNPRVRQGVVERLRDVPADEVGPAIHMLLSALDDPEDAVVETAIGSLGCLRAQAAREQLIALLGDQNLRIMQSAVFSLGRIGPVEEVGPLIIPFLAVNYDPLAITALKAIRDLNDRTAIPAIMDDLRTFIGKDLGVDSRAFARPSVAMQVLAAFEAQEAIPLLVELAESTVGLRNKAVDALKKINPVVGAEHLTRLLSRLMDDSSEPTLCESLLHLMRLADRRTTLPLVRRGLWHPARNVRIAALHVLSAWEDAASLPRIREMSRHDRDPFVRPAAVDVLAHVAGRDAIPALMELAVDVNSKVRFRALKCLQNSPDLPPEALEFLANPATRQSVDRPDDDGSLVPTDLYHQAASVRQFLFRWQSHLADRRATGEAFNAGAIEDALAVLIESLGPSDAESLTEVSVEPSDELSAE